MICPECKSEINDDLRECPNCGYVLKIDIANTNSVVTAKSSKNKYIGIAMCIAAVIFFVIGFSKINSSDYKFYKEHYKECMEGYADTKSTANSYSSLFFKSSYDSIASSYEDMANDDMKKITKFRVEAGASAVAGIALIIVGAKFYKKEEKMDGAN